jgi:Domain of unknown function (DUF4304)
VGAAQKAYEDAMTGVIAPALRDLGLVKVGKLFVLPDNSHWALLGIQKSRTISHSDFMEFTVNLGTVPKVDRQKRPTSTLHFSDFASYSRLGHLMPSSRDRWWSASTEPSGTFPTTTEVGRDVVSAVRDYGLPWLRQQIAASGTI